MKTRLLIIIGIIFISGLIYANSAHAIPFISHESSYENAKHVVIGKVLSVEILSEPYVQKSDNIYSERFGFALYEIQVEDYLKNPLNNSTMNLLGKYTNQRQTMSYETYPYEINQRVLLYIQEIHNIPGYELIISAANSRVIPEEFSSEDGMSRFEYNTSPLKQFKSGISMDKIQCRDNLQLILKTSNNSPTCVKPETKTKLLERGWGEYAPIPEPEIIKETDFDSEKYYEEFDSGSPLIYLDTSNPVLDNDNCERYAYWLTKYQKEKLDKYEDYPRYPPWGNQIFPLVDYCIKNGDLIKTIVNDKIQWSFSGISGNSEPEFKDEKITIIKISKGEIMSEKAIKFNGWTNQPNQEIVLTVTAPNGNIISTGKLSSMNNGTFADSITTGGPLWKQQDGIYLVTVQQGNDPTNSAYFELDLKDGNIITGK